MGTLPVDTKTEEEDLNAVQSSDNIVKPSSELTINVDETLNIEENLGDKSEENVIESNETDKVAEEVVDQPSIDITLGEAEAVKEDIIDEENLISNSAELKDMK